MTASMMSPAQAQYGMANRQAAGQSFSDLRNRMLTNKMHGQDLGQQMTLAEMAEKLQRQLQQRQLSSSERMTEGGWQAAMEQLMAQLAQQEELFNRNLSWEKQKFQEEQGSQWKNALMGIFGNILGGGITGGLNYAGQSKIANAYGQR